MLCFAFQYGYARGNIACGTAAEMPSSREENFSVGNYSFSNTLNLLHSEWPKLYGVLAILSAIGLR